MPFCESIRSVAYWRFVCLRGLLERICSHAHCTKQATLNPNREQPKRLFPTQEFELISGHFTFFKPATLRATSISSGFRSHVCVWGLQREAYVEEFEVTFWVNIMPTDPSNTCKWISQQPKPKTCLKLFLGSVAIGPNAGEIPLLSMLCEGECQ